MIRRHGSTRQDAARSSTVGTGRSYGVVRLNGSGMEGTSERVAARPSRHAWWPKRKRLDELGRHVARRLARSRVSAEGRQRKDDRGSGTGAVRQADPSIVGDLRPVDRGVRAAFANVNFARSSQRIGASQPTAGSASRETVTFLNVNDLDGTADRIMRGRRTKYLISVADRPSEAARPCASSTCASTVPA